MNDVIYMFNGKDITMNMCIQIRAVVDVIQENSVDNILYMECD